MKPKTLGYQIKMEKRLEDLVAEKEKRFQAFMANTREAVWRIDFRPPISIHSPESQQVREVFQNGSFGEANDALARMYGYSKGRDVIDRTVAEILPQSDPKNVESTTSFVRNEFLMDDVITYEKKAEGSTGVYLNNIVPTIKNDMVLHIWGSSVDITELSAIQERLKWSMEELENQKKVLNEKNIVLKEVIAQIESEKKDFQDRIIANLEHVILPSLDKIRLHKGAEEYIKQHRKSLEDLASSFGLKIADNWIKLTPREIEVCNLVKNGLTNKEIAQLLKISIHTVEKHRRTARNKLGLANQGVNLRTYLSSL
jgi:PAS domain S-box-containing protein